MLIFDFFELQNQESGSCDGRIMWYCDVGTSLFQTTEPEEWSFEAKLRVATYIAESLKQYRHHATFMIYCKHELFQVAEPEE